MPERLMQRLANGGRTGVFIAALVLILLAFAVPGWGGALLVTVIVAIMAAISRRTWAVQPPRVRVTRMGILVLLLLVAYIKAAHA
jgi:glucose-6-phosphate-specific signal transduction histidine kinase